MSTSGVSRVVPCMMISPVPSLAAGPKKLDQLLVLDQLSLAPPPFQTRRLGSVAVEDSPTIAPATAGNSVLAVA